MQARDASLFPGAVLDALADAADRPVFEHGDRLVTGQEVLDLTARAAAGLRAEGIGPGDGVALTLGIHHRAFATILAVYAVGARVMGLRPGLPATHVQYLLSLDNAVVITDHSTGYRTEHVPRTLDMDALLATEPEPLHPAARPDDVARLIHTSGSTGIPKPVAQTYTAMTAEWAWSPHRWAPAIGDLAPRMDRFLLFETLASQVVFQYTAMTVVIGGIVVVADLVDPYGPETLPGALARSRATATAVTVPRLSSMIAEQRTKPSDLSALQAILVSGSPLSHDRHHEAQAVLGPVVFHGYGQTEAGMIAMGTPADPPGTVGFPSDKVDLEIRDPRGELVPEGGEGELFVRTPGQSRGYWADPELTAEVYVDGWIRTRDLGLLDDDGRLRITGRARDVVIVDAAVHYIGPIERAVVEHPDVVEAYVVAVPDETTGEAVHAFVVPADGREPDPDEVRALVADRLGPACAPTRVTAIAAPPVGPSGKPDKLQLLHQALADTR